MSREQLLNAKCFQGGNPLALSAVFARVGPCKACELYWLNFLSLVLRIIG